MPLKDTRPQMPMQTKVMATRLLALIRMLRTIRMLHPLRPPQMPIPSSASN